MGYGIAVSLGAAALFFDRTLFGYPAFVVLLIPAAPNLITPKATIEAVTPAFLFLAACGLAIGLAFSLLGVETHGKPLALERDEVASTEPAASGEPAALAAR